MLPKIREEHFPVSDSGDELTSKGSSNSPIEVDRFDASSSPENVSLGAALKRNSL